MTNICLEGPVVIFRSEIIDVPDGPSSTRCPNYLRDREAAERAAAENSPTAVARDIHQKLADLYAAEWQAKGRLNG